MTIDADHRITRLNVAAERMFGCSAADVYLSKPLSLKALAAAIHAQLNKASASALADQRV